jgi:predicted nucleic acid-binding protein
VTWVVDASVALKWALPENDSDLAFGLLERTLIAPDWWLVEAGNGLWKCAGRGEITPEEAAALLTDLGEVPVTSVASRELLPRAIALACDLRHPIYDCLYLALALERTLKLVTADTRFLGLVDKRPDLSDHIVSLSSREWE